jgi:hypothetical protein
MQVLRGMDITASKDAVLATLRANKETHETIVKEAREGYVKKALAAVAAKEDELKSGKCVALTFRIEPPQSYKKVYETAIKMLEMHTGVEVTLNEEQVRSLIMDKWDWQRSWLLSNVGYSSHATSKLAQTYGEGDED